MITSKSPIYLASKSPRRRDMLMMMDINFSLLEAEIDEKINPDESPLKNVKRLALEKCSEALKKIKDGVIITADTIVVLDEEIIGKPKSKTDAKNILTKLSGKSHLVYTSFALANKKRDILISDYSKTKVYFKKLTQKEIKEYIATGSPMDKAGAYGIQDDFGAVFVEKIIGCYYNVLGFPVSKIYKGLQKVI